MDERLLAAQGMWINTIRQINQERAKRNHDLLCERCGLAVRANKDRYNVRMHYLCFHLEFEHGDTDPDEDCGVPGCQWDRNNYQGTEQ